MGNLFWTGADARVRVFASSSSWIEGAATKQLIDLLAKPGVRRVAGMPDLHPGHRGPVGCAVESEGMIHPSIIGTDIGCGMAMWALGVHERKLKLDRAEKALRQLGDDFRDEAIDAALAAGMTGAEEHAASLGTIGGGTHFLELQAVSAVADEEACAALGLERGDLVLLAHTGSRSLGAAVYARHSGAAGGLPIGDDGGYMADHDRALAYAAINRVVVLRRAAELLGFEGRPLVDVPHNHVEVRDGVALHRKGAAPSDRGIVPVPGSRGAATFLVRPTAGTEHSLSSIAHGAGRKRDRAGMVARAKSARAKSAERKPSTRDGQTGNRIICADKKLAAEEAPEAYKDIRRIMADLEEFGLARAIAELRPVVTFKTAEV